MFTFQFLNDKIYSYTKKTPFGTYQFGEISVLVNCIIQKLNHLFGSVFSGDSFFFEGTRENILYIYSGPKIAHLSKVTLLAIAIFYNVHETFTPLPELLLSLFWLFFHRPSSSVISNLGTLWLHCECLNFKKRCYIKRLLHKPRDCT